LDLAFFNYQKETDVENQRINSSNNEIYDTLDLLNSNLFLINHQGERNQQPNKALEELPSADSSSEKTVLNAS
jgi:hypothetical protein